MSIRFVCPLGHPLEMPDDRAGTEDRCPVCQQRLFVPEISPAEAAPPLPRNDAAVVAEPTSNGNPPVTPPAVRWLAWLRADALTDYAIVRPTSKQLEMVYWLACLLPFAAAFCAAPALPHLYFSGAPLWAQLMLIVAMLKLAYAAWLGFVPDRSSVCVGMYLMAAGAIAYLIAFSVICSSSETQLAALGVAGMRGAAATWCLVALVISAAASAACGWFVRRWQDQPATP